MKLIDGPFLPVRIKVVSQKTIKKIVGHEAYGLYVSQENQIYLAKDQTKEQMLHTLLHELIHASEDQIKNHNEESRCDIMATWIIKLTNIKLEKLLG